MLLTVYWPSDGEGVRHAHRTPEGVKVYSTPALVRQLFLLFSMSPLGTPELPGGACTEQKPRLLRPHRLLQGVLVYPKAAALSGVTVLHPQSVPFVQVLPLHT